MNIFSCGDLSNPTARLTTTPCNLDRKVGFIFNYGHELLVKGIFQCFTTFGVR